MRLRTFARDTAGGSGGRASNARSNSCRPAGLSFGIRYSPSNRSAGSQSGLRDGASQYDGQLLHAKTFQGASVSTSLARAGFRRT